MDRKKLVLLIGALIVAIGSALGVRSMIAGAATPQANAATVVAKTGPRVLVAKRALPTGTIISADALQYQPWPDELVQDAYFIEGEADMNALMGTVVRFPVTAGQPVTQGALVSPKDRGFLAAALSPGMRAVTVPVSDKTGVSGFVFPGDRVDLVLTSEVSGDNGETLRAAETILTNLRVLATDQSTTSEVVDGKTVAKVSRTVTIEVTPKIAEKVAVAQSVGTISLSLRSLSDNSSELDGAIAQGEINIPAGATPAEEARLLRSAQTRPSEARGSISTGGDVSRFQRRTMPPKGASASPGTFVERSEPAASPSPAVPTGPVVRVSRGKDITAVPVGK